MALFPCRSGFLSRLSFNMNTSETKTTLAMQIDNLLAQMTDMKISGHSKADINELFQNKTNCEVLHLSQVYDFDYVYDLTNALEKKFTVRIGFTYKGERLSFSATDLKLKLCEDKVVERFWRFISVIQEPVDAQMDSTSSQNTQAGMENAESDKTENVILTTGSVSTPNQLLILPNVRTITPLMAAGEGFARFPKLHNRWIPINKGNFERNNIQNLIIAFNSLPKDVLSKINVPNMQPFRSYMFCAPEMEIKIEINSHKFAVGKYIASYIYNPTNIQALTTGALGTEENSVYYFINTINRDHVMIDLAESNEVSLKIPFKSHRPWIGTRFVDDEDYADSLYCVMYIQCIAPYNAPDDAPSVVPFTIFAKFTDCKFNGLRYTRAPVDGQLDFFKGVINAVTNLPIIGKSIVAPVAQSFGNLAVGVSSLFASDAWVKDYEKNLRYIGVLKNRDKPSDIRPPLEYRPNTLNSLASGVGPESVLSMRLDPAATTIALPEHDYGFPQSIRELTRIWGYRNEFDWSMTQGAQSNLFSFPTTPTHSYAHASSSKQSASYMCQFSQFYAYACGSREFRFDFVCNQFHTGMLLISFTPDNEVLDYDEAIAGYCKYVDIREQRSFTFVCPYIASTVIKETGQGCDLVDKGLIAPTWGYISVYVVNPLTPIQNVVTSIKVIVYERGGEDFQLCYPNHPGPDTKLPDIYDLSYGIVSNARSLDGVRYPVDGQMETQEDVDGTAQFGTVPAMSSVLQIGEDHMKIADLLRRWIFWDEITVDAASTLEIPCVTQAVTKRSLQAFIMRQARWYRGSMRYLMVYKGSDDNVFNIWHIPKGPILYGAVPYVTTDTYAIGGTNGFQVWNTRINPTIKLEIPFHGPFDFIDTQLALGGPISAYPVRALSNLGRIKLYETTGTKAFTIQIWMSCGDDFMLAELNPMTCMFSRDNYAPSPTLRHNRVEEFAHDKDCCWSNPNCLEGPDTCACVLKHLRKTLKPVDGQMDNEEIPVRRYSSVPTTPSTPESDPMNQYIGPTDATLPRTRMWDFCKSAKDRVYDAVTSPITLYSDLRSRVNQAKNTLTNVDYIADKANNALEYLKDVANNIVNGIKKAFTWLNCTGAIFSAVLHFLQVCINPSWQTFVIAITGIFSTMGLFFTDLAKNILEFFLSLRVPADHRTGNTVDGQVDDENTPIFSDDEIGTMCGLIFGSISAYLGYKGEKPSAGIATKLFSFSKNFWMTIFQSGKFLTSLVTLIKRIYSFIVNRSMENQEAIILAKENASTVAFIEEAQKMMDQRNLHLIQTQPSMKYRFWCCVAAAYQMQARLTLRSTPQSAAILRICQKVIDLANQESIQAMACPVRYEPFVLAIEGASKIGKSAMLQTALPDVLADETVYGVRTYDNPIFVRTPGVEFWNGYRNQPCILYDDYMTSTSPEIATPQVVEMFNLKSSAIMNMNMASLNDKALRGNPLVVALSTNSPFVVPNGVTCNRAFLRRRDALWKVELKPQYKAIGEVPEDVFAECGHLQFRKYKDSTDPNSLNTYPVDYRTWMLDIKHEMREYHLREQRNVRIRMEGLKKLLPERAATMMREVDPFRIFYAAYIGGAESSPMQTGMLPSEVLEETISIIRATAADMNTPSISSVSVNGSGVDGQIDWLRLMPDFKNLWHKFCYAPVGTVPFYVLEEPVNNHECTVCREEGPLYMTCVNSQQHGTCYNCYCEMNTIAEDRGTMLRCPVCRGETHSVHVAPEMFYERLRIIVFWEKIKEGAVRRYHSSRRYLRSLLSNPEFYFYVLYFCVSFLVFKSQMNNQLFLYQDSQRIAELASTDPYAMYAMNPYLRHHMAQMTVQGQVDEMEPSASQPTKSRHMMRPIQVREEEVVNGPNCPHVRLMRLSPLEIDYDRSMLSGKKVWMLGDYDPEEIPDAPCQYAECPFKDSVSLGYFLNRWALARDETIQMARNRWNANPTSQWNLPPEFVSDKIDEADKKRQSDLILAVRRFGREKSWTELIGEKWCDMSKWIKVMVALVSAIAGFTAMYKLVKWIAGPSDVVGQITNSGSYVNKRLPRVPRAIRQTVASGQVGTFNSEACSIAQRAVIKNTIIITATYDDGTKKKMSYRGLGLFGRVCVIPKHMAMHIVWLTEKYQSKLSMRLFHAPGTEVPLILESNCFLYGENEFAYFRAPTQFPMFKDITNLVPTAEQHADISGKYAHFEPSMENMTSTMIIGNLKGRRDIQPIRATEWNTQYDMFDIYETTYGRPGACGAIYLSETTSPLFAMHVAGDNRLGTGVGYGVPLVREDLLDLKAGTLVVSEFIPNGISPPKNGQMSLGGAIVPIGSVKKEMVSYLPEKTKIIPSLLHCEIEGIRALTQPGILSAKDERFVFDGSPLLWGCTKHTIPILPMKTLNLERISSYLCAMFVDRAPPLRNVKKRLTLEQAVVGLEDVEYYDCMDLATSSGWPWNLGEKKDKENFIKVERNPKTQRAINCVFDEGLAQTLALKSDMRRKGIKPFTVFLDWLKDERRKPSKIALPDGTRIFSLSPVDFSIQLRQRTLDFSAAMMAARHDLPHGVGTAGDGPEWSRIANSLLMNSKCIVTGDYKDFGPRLSAQAIKVAFEVMVHWYKTYADLTVEEECELWVMYEELAHAKHIMKDFIYEVMSGAPSGSALTVIINTISNIVYILDAWLELTVGTKYCSVDSFFLNVVMYAYGDDVIFSVKEEVLEIFNCETIAKYFATLDITFTDAHKSGTIKCETLEESTFLKRSFLRHPTRPGHWLAPLETLSIHECALWIWKSRDDAMATKLNAEQSLLLSYGHGPKFFKEWKKKLNTALNKIGLPTLSLNWLDLDVKFFGPQPLTGSFVRSPRIHSLVDLNGANVKGLVSGGSDRLNARYIKSRHDPAKIITGVTGLNGLDPAPQDGLNARSASGGGSGLDTVVEDRREEEEEEYVIERVERTEKPILNWWTRWYPKGNGSGIDESGQITGQVKTDHDMWTRWCQTSVSGGFGDVLGCELKDHFLVERKEN